MTRQRLKSIRLSADLIEAAEREADMRGITFTDIVESSLRQELDFVPNPTLTLLGQVKRTLDAAYPNKSIFPQDVTRLIFLQIRDDPRLRALYDRVIANGAGNPEHRRNLHRQLGHQIKRVLDARVLRKMIPTGQPDELIRAYSLLVPSESSDEP